MDFNKLAKSIIEPILILFRFKLKQEIKGILEYDHKYIAITISYDYNSSYEVDITLLFKESGLFYGYNELNQYFYNSNPSIFAIQIKNESTLVKWLEKVNEFLNDNLSTIIENYMEIQIGLERIRHLEIDNYENERNNRLLNEGVEKYWTIKDYSGLVKFLKNYDGELKEIIKKKYEYALKRVREK